MKEISSFLGRAPFVILGVLGILSIVGTFITLEENIALTLEAWRSVTRPIWQFLIGWLFELIGLVLPWYAKDYFSLGAVTVAMHIRSNNYIRNTEIGKWLVEAVRIREGEAASKTGSFLDWRLNIRNFFLWPVEWFKKIKFQLKHCPKSQNSPEQDRSVQIMQSAMKNAFGIYWETVIYVIILIGLNFLLVSFLSFPSEPPEIEIWV